MALLLFGLLRLFCQAFGEASGAWMVFENWWDHSSNMTRLRHRLVTHGIFGVLQAATFEENVLRETHGACVVDQGVEMRFKEEVLEMKPRERRRGLISSWTMRSVA